MEETQKRYKPQGRVVVRRIGEDILLVPVSGPAAGGRVFPINETAFRIWEALADGATVEAIASTIAETYSVPIETARTDCTHCLSVLLEEQLIEEEA